MWLHAELNLFKLGDGRNIAGMLRQVTQPSTSQQLAGGLTVGRNGRPMPAARAPGEPR